LFLRKALAVSKSGNDASKMIRHELLDGCGFIRQRQEPWRANARHLIPLHSLKRPWASAFTQQSPQTSFLFARRSACSQSPKTLKKDVFLLTMGAEPWLEHPRGS